jgi:2-isopropylmalate synthase
MTRIDPNYVLIFDTTLRDGEQSPGASMMLQEKLEIAKLLEEMGVDIIEAGFPATSNGDFAAVNEIARVVKTSTVAGLARAALEDIDRCGEALQPAARSRIHTFISTSPVHMKYKLRMGANEVLDAVGAAVKRARRYTEDVEWGAEDATRTERDFLFRCVELAIRCGANTINIGDTVGYATPEEYFDLIMMLRAHVPGADEVVFSTHCHNDLGLAVANSLAGVRAGARQIECTVNGIGERAGNAALEEVVMALKVRRDVLPYHTAVKSEALARISKLVSGVTGFPVQYNKAIVGRNAFAHESGIHQDGMLKHIETYEIMRPETVGVKQTSLIIGKHSGRHAFRKKLEELGYCLDEATFEDGFRRFKDLADRNKHVYDEDIETLFDEKIARTDNPCKLALLTVLVGERGPQRATMKLDIDGKPVMVEADATGSADAIFNGLKELVSHQATSLQLNEARAATEGVDAHSEVSVGVEGNVRTVTRWGTDSDSLVADTGGF